MFAIPAVAHVIGVLFSGLAGRPTGGKRLTAGAADKTAQGKVGAEIGTRGNMSVAVQALLNPVEGFQRNKSFMLALLHGHAPTRQLNIARIDKPRENTVGGLVGHHAETVLGELGKRSKEAGYFGLGFKPSRGQPLKPFTDDGREGLIRHHDLAVAFYLLLHIAEGWSERPVPFHKPCRLALDGLFGVLFTKVMRAKGLHIFDIAPVGISSKGNGRAFNHSTAFVNGIPQVKVNANIPRQTADIVDHDDEAALAFMLF